MLTGLYYDPNTQYYFNNQLNKFLFWDNANSTYVVAPDNSTSDSVNMTVKPNIEENKNPKIEKVKVAKKIAKDMERWAKTLNQKKETIKRDLETVVVPSTSTSISNKPVTADICYSLVEKAEKNSLITFDAVPATTKQTNSPLESPFVDKYEFEAKKSIVPYENDHESSGDESEYVDFNQLTCLICKRQFPSKDTLVKHTKKSLLHKQNLAIVEMQNGGKKHTKEYVDRAKERRLKSDPEPPVRNRAKERYLKSIAKLTAGPTTSAPPVPIESSNIGNKLLQKMGWSEGQGLGRSNQGRTNIIEAEARAGNAGLGSTKVAVVKDDYKAFMKKMMRTRYNEGPPN